MHFQEVSPETTKFHDLFDNNHSPSSAYLEFKRDLRDKLGLEGYMKASADNSILPISAWVFRCYGNYVRETYGSINGPEAYDKACQRVKEYNAKHGKELAQITQTEDGQLVIHFWQSVMN